MRRFDYNHRVAVSRGGAYAPGRLRCAARRFVARGWQLTGADRSRSLTDMDLDGTELREGYADVGDVSLHYVELGEGPLIVLLHGFPEFWFGWRLQIKRLADAGRREGLRHRPSDRRHPRTRSRTRCRVSVP